MANRKEKATNRKKDWILKGETQRMRFYYWFGQEFVYNVPVSDCVWVIADTIAKDVCEQHEWDKLPNYADLHSKIRQSFIDYATNNVIQEEFLKGWADYLHDYFEDEAQNAFDSLS